MWKGLGIFSAIVAVTLLPYGAEAGRSCEDMELTAEDLSRASYVAVNLKRRLDTSDSQLVMLARIGSDISDQGLKYTHAGLARKMPDTGKWVVFHQLNRCGTAYSEMFEHGLLQFMLDDPYDYEVLLVEVPMDLQKSVVARLENKDALRLHEPKYNMIANPRGSTRYQNSNQWVLEVFAQAQASMDGELVIQRDQAISYYLSKGFEGSDVSISTFKRIFAGFKSNVQFDDHPDRARRAKKYEVVTVKSVVNYLTNNNLLDRKLEISEQS